MGGLRADVVQSTTLDRREADRHGHQSSQFSRTAIARKGHFVGEITAGPRQASWLAAGRRQRQEIGFQPLPPTMEQLFGQAQIGAERASPMPD